MKQQLEKILNVVYTPAVGRTRVLILFNINIYMFSLI